MNELLLRRRMMAMSKKEPFVNPYITDGLVLHLDGIEKGSTPDAWTDLINGIVFTKKAGGVTFNSDNVQFGGSSNNALHNLTTYDFARSTVGTIEVCYRDIATSGFSTVFYTYAEGASTGTICFQFVGGNRVSFSTGNASSRPHNGAWTAESTGTYSVSNARAYQNGINKGYTSDKTYITKTIVGTIIGCSGRASSTYFDPLNGKIHSIRIYNRQLTEEEILHNQAIDNTRFHLGLEL